MLKSPEFIVVKVLVTNNKNEPVLRSETLPVDIIKKIRSWHNTGSNGIDKELPMVQMHLKSEISFDDKDDTKKLTKILLLQEDCVVLNEKIGAVIIS